MSNKPLAGKKIAVLMETEYIPAEISAYEKQFTDLGAEVHVMSRLWGNQSLTFVSDVDAAVDNDVNKTRARLEIRTVSFDLEKANLDDYAAVIMAANYTSVRLRWFQAPEDIPKDTPISSDMVRQAPAVRFFARAMRDPRIVKGALCHALWILTPVPELLAGRRVICNPVVLADVVNAGGIYTPSSDTATERTPYPNIVVDDDLVTGVSFHDVDNYIKAIVTQIGRRDRPAAPAPQPAPTASASGKRKRILVVLSEWGYWGEELVGPVEMFDKAGYQVDFATPTGKRPIALAPSMNPEFIDPPLQRSVTSPEVAYKTREFDDPSLRSPQYQRLNNPINLSARLPERPYWNVPSFGHLMEAYNRELVKARGELRAVRRAPDRRR